MQNATMVHGAGVSSKYYAITMGYVKELKARFGEPKTDEEKSALNELVYKFTRRVKYATLSEFEEYYELYSSTYPVEPLRHKKRFSEGD